MAHTTLTKERIKYMSLLIDAEKALNKIQYPFMIKILNKVSIEGKYLKT